MVQKTSPRRIFLVVVVTLTLSLLALLGNGRSGGALGRVLFLTLSPLRDAVGGAGRSVHSVWLDYIDLTEVRQKNIELESELNELRDKVAQTEDLRAENERLHQLLELADSRKDLRLQAVRVVSHGNSSIFRILDLVLDIGDLQVEPGMPVIAPGGIVGQIHIVMGNRAEVLLITDPRSAVDVVLESSRARGVAVGTGEPDQYTAELKYLQGESPAIKGERVLTTGDEGRYPRGLIVGEVTAVGDAGTSAFQRAIVKPRFDLGALDEVLIVLGPTGLTEQGTLEDPK